MSRRGRSYVRHHVDAGSGDAMVKGSETYSRAVRIAIQPLSPLTRTTMAEACAAKWILWQNSFKGGSLSPCCSRRLKRF